MADYWQLEENTDQWQLEENTDLWLLEESAGEAVVPFNRKAMPTILAAWAAAPIILWSNGFTIPETSANVPNARGWLPSVVAQWEPPTDIRQARRLVPQGLVVAEDKVPYTRAAQRVAFDAWLEADQGTQAGQPRARQIVSVDAPPPRSRLQESLRQAWEPESWQAQSARHAPLELVAAADSPLPRPREWLQRVIDGWTPQATLLWQNGFLAQDGPAEVNEPPYGLRPWLRTVRDAWEPEAVRAPAQRKLAQGFVAVSDAPPPRSKLQEAIRQQWQPENWGAQSARHTPQAAAAVADVPPPNARRTQLWAALESWQQTLVPYWALGGSPVVQAQPFAGREWLEVVRRSWDAEPETRQRRRFLVQGAAVVTDNPPFGLRSWRAAVAQAWEPIAVRAPAQRKLAQGFVAISDAPPPRARAREFVGQQWQPVSWEAQSARQAPQGYNPPAPASNAWVFTILQAWEPPAQPIQRRARVTAGAVVVADLPPFGLSRRIWQILASWEPGPPAAQGPGQILQSQPLVYSSVSLRTRIGSTSAHDGQLRIGTERAVDSQQGIGTSTATTGSGRIGSEDA